MTSRNCGHIPVDAYVHECDTCGKNLCGDCAIHEDITGYEDYYPEYLTWCRECWDKEKGANSMTTETPTISQEIRTWNSESITDIALYNSAYERYEHALRALNIARNLAEKEAREMALTTKMTEGAITLHVNTHESVVTCEQEYVEAKITLKQSEARIDMNKVTFHALDMLVKIHTSEVHA